MQLREQGWAELVDLLREVHLREAGECSGRLIWDETPWLGLGIVPIFLLKNVLTASFLILQPWNEIVLHCVFFSSNHYFAINWRQVSALSFQCRLLAMMNHKGMIDIAVWWFRPLSGSKRTHRRFSALQSWGGQYERHGVDHLEINIAYIDAE